AILLPDLIDGADIGMIKGRGRLCLALEPGQCQGVLGDLIGQKLQGDKPAESDVLGLIDDTHPAAADLLNNAIVRNGLAEHVVRICPGAHGMGHVGSKSTLGDSNGPTTTPSSARCAPLLRDSRPPAC